MTIEKKNLDEYKSSNYKVKNGLGNKISLYLNNQSGNMEGYMINAKEAQELAQDLLIATRQMRLNKNEK